MASACFNCGKVFEDPELYYAHLAQGSCEDPKEDPEKDPEEKTETSEGIADNVVVLYDGAGNVIVNNPDPTVADDADDEKKKTSSPDAGIHSGVDVGGGDPPAGDRSESGAPAVSKKGFLERAKNRLNRRGR